MSILPEVDPGSGSGAGPCIRCDVLLSLTSILLTGISSAFLLTLTKMSHRKTEQARKRCSAFTRTRCFALVLFVSLHVCELALPCLPVFSLLPLPVDNPRCYSSPAAARGKDQLLDLGQEMNSSKQQCPSSALQTGHALFIDSF